MKALIFQSLEAMDLNLKSIVDILLRYAAGE